MQFFAVFDGTTAILLYCWGVEGRSPQRCSSSPVTYPSARNSHTGSGTHPTVQEHRGTWSPQLLELKGTTVKKVEFIGS